jgi:ribonuclease-3
MPETRGQGTLLARLGLTFRDPDLFKLALTHSSVEGVSQQRLEFLGDAVLAAVVSEALYRKAPDWDEGALSVARTRYVCKEHLATVAEKLALGEALLVRADVARSGPVHAMPAVLADTMEALVGAVFLDSGYEAARDFVIRHILAVSPVSETQDAKTRLQQWCQGRRQALPQYTLLSEAGPKHQLTFTVSCRLSNPPLVAEASATSRKLAEQRAAEDILNQLERRT